MFYCIERLPRSWIPSQKFSLGVSLRAFSRASSARLGARKHRREATSYTRQLYRMSSFARAPSRSQFGKSFLRKLRLALSLTTWELEGVAALTHLRSSSQDFSEVADEPPHRCPLAHIKRTGARSQEPRGLFPPTEA